MTEWTPGDPSPLRPELPAHDGAHAFLRTAAAIGVFILIYIALAATGGELYPFALAGLQIFPFVILATLAYASEARKWAQIATFTYWLLLMAAVIVVAMTFTIAGLVNPESGLWMSTAGDGPRPLPDVNDLFDLSGAIRLLAAVLAMILSLVLGLVCFLRPIREYLAGWIAIDPRSFVHTVALATVIPMTFLFFIPLIASGQPPALALMAQLPEEAADPNQDLRTAVYGLIWALPASWLAVGFPEKRSFREALQRLGLVAPSRRQVIGALVATAGLFLLMNVLNILVGLTWQLMGWRQTDPEAIARLFDFAIGPIGAVIIGVTSGLGEEAAFRGVLQPRVGILVAALLFSSVHAFQYDFDALLQVFIMGVTLGLIRKASNTTTSAIVHGLYNFAAFIQAYLSGAGL